MMKILVPISSGDDPKGFLVMGVMFIFVMLVWGLSLKMTRTDSSDTRFYCGMGLYGCYLVGSNAIYLYVFPNTINRFLELGTITMEDTAICSILLVITTVFGLNLLGIAAVIAWRRSQKRKELSALERMKLEDM